MKFYDFLRNKKQMSRNQKKSGSLIIDTGYIDTRISKRISKIAKKL